MKISFPKCGPGQFLTPKQGATRIIWFVAIASFAGVCGSYFLGNKLWMLTIAVLGIAGILLCFGAAVAIFFNQSEVKEAPSAPIEANVPRLTPQWDYRPRKPIRARGALDSPSVETSDDLSSDPFLANDNVWCNDNSPECGSHTFVNDPPAGEDLITSPLPQTTGPPRTARAIDDGSI
jgi:hypothetical protein